MIFLCIRHEIRKFTEQIAIKTSADEIQMRYHLRCVTFANIAVQFKYEYLIEWNTHNVDWRQPPFRFRTFQYT